MAAWKSDPSIVQIRPKALNGSWVSTPNTRRVHQNKFWLLSFLPVQESRFYLRLYLWNRSSIRCLKLQANALTEPNGSSRQLNLGKQPKTFKAKEAAGWRKASFPRPPRLPADSLWEKAKSTREGKAGQQPLPPVTEPLPPPSAANEEDPLPRQRCRLRPPRAGPGPALTGGPAAARPAREPPAPNGSRSGGSVRSGPVR